MGDSNLFNICHEAGRSLNVLYIPLLNYLIFKITYKVGTTLEMKKLMHRGVTLLGKVSQLVRAGGWVQTQAAFLKVSGHPLSFSNVDTLVLASFQVVAFPQLVHVYIKCFNLLLNLFCFYTKWFNLLLNLFYFYIKCFNLLLTENF